jgi:hypothetical protein
MQQDTAPVTAFLQINGFVVIVPSPVKLFAIVFEVRDDSDFDLMAKDCDNPGRSFAVKD